MGSEYTFIGPVSQLLTLAALPLKGPIPNSQLFPLATAGILLHKDRVFKTGSYLSLKEEAARLQASIVDPGAESVLLPGWIDAHTHICFAGSRSADYSARNEGKTYLEIAAAGGGISDTVRQTRRLSREALTKLVVQRAQRHLQNGVTTIEVKSGYGLSVEEEIKMMRAIAEASVFTKADLVSTCLAAHILPTDFEGTATQYLETISRELLPVLLTERISRRVDVFVESKAFSVQEAHDYVREAKQKGFDITIHADQFTTGGSALAVSVGAVSADHLEASTEKEIRLLAGSDTVAVALPGASLGLGCAFAPARKLLDAGACLAIASDWNPGSAPMGDLLCAASLLGTFEKLSDAEVFAGLTFRAARALRLAHHGQIEEGSVADFIIYPATDFREILYHQGMLKPAQVWKRGIRVV